MSDGLIRLEEPASRLWWVHPGRLAGMAMPYLHPERRLAGGGPLEAWADDLPALHRDAIRAVVCLLNLAGDQGIYRDAGMQFRAFPMADGAPPEMEQAKAIVEYIRNCLADNLPVAVHCIAGLGRTGTVLAMYLIAEGMGARAAIDRIRSREPGAIETRRQLEFLEEFESTWRRWKL